MTTTPETGNQATMLRSVKDLIGYPIKARDGDLGKCKDFLFDDAWWTIRYLVVDTQRWLPGRKVLISPYQFGDPELGSSSRRFEVELTKERIKESPDLDADSPVSRLYELELAQFYNYQPYWIGGGVWGGDPYPTGVGEPPATPDEWESHAAELRKIEKHHLRSADEVMGYHISAEDGEIGHVEDFVVETASWTIRWMIVDTRNWLPGRKVVISPTWIEEVSWPERRVSVDLTREAIKSSPEFDDRAPINRDYEGFVYDYYGRPRYW